MQKNYVFVSIFLISTFSSDFPNLKESVLSKNRFIKTVSQRCFVVRISQNLGINYCMDVDNIFHFLGMSNKKYRTSIKCGMGQMAFNQRNHQSLMNAFAQT